MPFPAANGTSTPLAPNEAWAQSRNAAASIQNLCTQMQAQIAAGMSSQSVIQNYSYLYSLTPTQLSGLASLLTTLSATID